MHPNYNKIDIFAELTIFIANLISSLDNIKVCAENSKELRMLYNNLSIQKQQFKANWFREDENLIRRTLKSSFHLIKKLKTYPVPSVFLVWWCCSQCKSSSITCHKIKHLSTLREASS